MANVNRQFNIICNDKFNYDYIDKKEFIDSEIQNMLCKTMMMFEYKNLPEEIDIFDLEYMLQVNGSCIFTKVDNMYYVFVGGLGGERNAYYHPTIDIVANPYLRLSKMFTIQDEKDGVLIKNDFFYRGVNYINYKFAKMYVESLITSQYQLYNARIPSLAIGESDNDITDLNNYFDSVIKGEKLKGVVSKSLMDGIKTQDYSKMVNNMKDVMELQQYYYSQWLIAFGVNSAYNMKRESIGESESSINDKALLPFCDMMLKCRQSAFKKINKKYNLNVSVDFTSAWKKLRKEMQEKQEVIDTITDERSDETTDETTDENVKDGD